jgi:iron complex outermembrane receptor protein
MRNLRWMLAAGTAGAVMASAAGAARAAANDTNLASVSEVVVTAQKREQTVQDLPGVVTAISGDRIKALGVSNIENLASQASGLTFYTQAGANFVTLRGVGVPIDNGSADNNISINVDGVVLPRQSEAGLDSTDLQRVEVLRGPQGTLYGRNATGGAINFISAPPTQTFTGMVSAKIANYETWGVNGFVSGPISDHFRFRLSASHEERDKGYVRNVFTGGTEDKLDRTGVRVALSADLAPNLTADLSFSWQRERFDGYQALLPPGLVVPNAPASSLGNLATLGLVQGRDYSIKPFETGSDYPGHSERKTLLTVAKLKWDVTDHISVTSLTGYIDHTFMGGLDGDATSYPLDHIAFGGPNGRTQPSQSFSQEFNVSGAFARRGSWLVGAYYFHEDVDFILPVILDTTISPLFQPGTVSRTGTSQTSTSYAIFADATVPITDNLRIFGGARLSKEKFTAQSLSETINPNGIFRPALVPLLPRLFGIPAQNPTNISCLGSIYQAANTQPTYPIRPISGQEHTPFTPRVGAQYDVTGNVMLYVQYSKGFKAGGQAPSNCANQYEPESLAAYEAGIKAQFLDKHLTFNASAFHYDYSNMQIFKIEGTGSTLIENAGAKIDGVDVTAEALFGQYFRTDIAATVLNDRFTDFCSTDPSWPSLARPCPNGVGTGQDLRGRPLPNVPNYTVNAGLEGVFPLELGLFDRFTLRGEAQLVGPTQMTSYGNRPETRRAAYTLVNATATLASQPGDLLVRAFVRNIGDKAVLAHVIWIGTLNGQWQPPRTYGVEVTKRF